MLNVTGRVPYLSMSNLLIGSKTYDSVLFYQVDLGLLGIIITPHHLHLAPDIDYTLMEVGDFGASRRRRVLLVSHYLVPQPHFV